MVGLFTKRYTKPTASNKEFVRTAKGGWSRCVQGSPTDSACDSLANCVGYACGRFNEIYNEIMSTTGMKYYGLNCNAENFIKRAKEMYPDLQFSDRPFPGAILVWEGAGSLAGHVAIVEDILETDSKGFPTKIKTSESAYGGSAFYVSTRTNDNGAWGLNTSKYSVNGFILNPAVKLVEPVERDLYKDQVNVKESALRLRKTPSNKDMSNYWGSFCPVGIFNVLEVYKDSKYDWYRIEDDVWIAKVTDVDFLPRIESQEVELKKRIKELEAKIAEYEAIINEVRKAVK